MRLPFAAGFLLACSAAPAADPPAKVSYYRDVRPVFQQQCQGCHQPAKATGGYVMTEFAALLSAGESGKPAVVPGRPDRSYLLDQIAVRDGHAEMPKNRPPLSDAQVKLVATWVQQGAADDTPPAARAAAVDADHPPVYKAPPVVPSVAFSPDGRLLAVAGYHEVLLHAADGSGVAARLVGASERVQAVAFSPDGKRLAVAAGDPGRLGEVQVWDVAKRKLAVSAPVTFDTLYGLSWSPDGSKVAFGCADNTVRAIDPATGKQVLLMGTHSDLVLGTAFCRDGTHLLSVGRDMTLKLTEVPTQRFVDNVTSITPGALKGGLMAVDVRPVTTGRWFQKRPSDTPTAPRRLYDEVLVAGADGTPRLYKVHREEPRKIGDDSNRLKVFDPLPGRVSAVRFDPSGKRFAAACTLDGRGEVRVVEVASGAKVVCAGTAPAYTVAWRPDGGLLASAGFDGAVRLHDPSTGKLVREFPAVPLVQQQVAK